jgi:hypothetical protein
MLDKALISKPITQPTEILTHLHSGQLLRVYGRRGSALVICHTHHAELAGPGAAVGSIFDLDCRRAIPLGNPALVYPKTREERQKAFAIRQQWVCFTQKAMNSYVPLQRSRAILFLLERYFSPEIVRQIPDDVISQLVGVFPKTVQMARQTTAQSVTQQERVEA